MTYQETVAYLYSQLPAFQKIGVKAINPSLDKIEKFCENLGKPQNRFKAIHVAGTNGKGSSSHMLASVFQEAGYKTGLYSSPHLKDFRERFKINGQLTSEDFVISFVKDHQSLIKKIKPSFFELTVAMAFQLFAKEKVDIAIIEVGLGGRLDSTNIINPILSLITNIGLDHVNILGDTLEKIAFEKAGIIKKEIPVVISERIKETENVFRKKAEKYNSEIYFSENHFVEISTKKSTNTLVSSLREKEEWEIDLDLNGDFQIKNVLGVLTVFEVLNKNGFNIQKQQILKGLSQVIINTGLKGRWQSLSSAPLTLCDIGHNLQSFSNLGKYLQRYKPADCHLVLGFSNDKDVIKMLSCLPSQANYYFCAFNSPRSMPLEEVNMIANEINIQNMILIENVNEAIRFAQGKAMQDDFIYIGGSTYLVAEIDNL